MLADYNRAIELDPNDARYYRARGLWLLQKGRKAEARKDLEKALELDAKLKPDIEPVLLKLKD
jgi:Flp pilus assembly protein TadD